jgi:hypothetical protein
MLRVAQEERKGLEEEFVACARAQFERMGHYGAPALAVPAQRTIRVTKHPERGVWKREDLRWVARVARLNPAPLR